MIKKILGLVGFGAVFFVLGYWAREPKATEDHRPSESRGARVITKSPGSSFATAARESGGRGSGVERAASVSATGKTGYLTPEEIEKQLGEILNQPPSANRTRLLGEISHRIPLQTILSSDSPFKLEELTEDEISTLASRISARIGQSTDLADVELAIKSKDSVFHSYLAQGIVAGLLRSTDPRDAWGKVDSWATDPASKQKLHQELGFAIGYRSPADFLKLVEGPEGAEVIRSGGKRFVEGWASNDPKSALLWAYGLDNAIAPQQDKSKLTRVAYASWCANESFAASEWLSAAAPGKDRDVLTVELINYLLIKKDLEHARNWIGFIQDEGIREKIDKAVATMK